ncbi:hypothetical protein [uncultured Sphingomonas sp.]|uniref:hypothetical protein n=1 Tax=uncultured Sphingomonas sp. TaxID=158754 RepID=UPI0025E88E33|nr:hypothetical protein [uncultured Sphingomonas sp.]
MIAMIVLLAPTFCHGPTGNPTTLSAIRVESRALMQGPDFWWTAGNTDRRLPPTIAQLRPDIVSVVGDGVDIYATNFFDGGWGYHVPRVPNPSPDTVFRHQKVADGVYWFHPY